MSWLALGLVVLWVADALRLRGRMALLPRLPLADPDPASEDEEDADAAFLDTWTCLRAPGVKIARHTLLAAARFAKARGLEAVDLIPGDLRSESLLGLLATYDPKAWARDPFRPGRSAGQAIVLTRALAARVGLAEATIDDEDNPDAPPTIVAESLGLFLQAAGEVRRCTAGAPDETLDETGAPEAAAPPRLRSSLIVAPGLRAAPRTLRQERHLFDAVVGRGATFVLVAQGLVLALLGLLIVTSPLLGLAAALAFNLQPLIVTSGRGLQPADLDLMILLRTPATFVRFVGLLRAGRTPSHLALPEARETYKALLPANFTELFEARREACPLCQSDRLVVHLQVPDLYQHKPGRFTLERCEACSLIFQNPRLSLEGLAYYYRDFYDGLGEASMETIFGASRTAYHARAASLEGLEGATGEAPRRWLDVGGGHGHFCVIAREHFPTTRFEVLDLADSIEAARRRGWVDAAHRGLFPELAPKLLEDATQPIDVVSMSHYLEHVRDPEAEIEAAAKVLPEGGHLMIEIPDPESKIPKILGRYWIPFFQPQHQHLLSAKHIDQLLGRHGFTPVRWARGSAHIPVDFFMASWMMLSDLAGAPGKPWRPEPTVLSWVRHDLVWALGFWVLPTGWLIDRLAARFLRRGGWSNAFRVVARKG